jgi:hypothetical protein
MHEVETCEISLLWCSSAAFWSPATAVCAMPPHMDGSATEARAYRRHGAKHPVGTGCQSWCNVSCPPFIFELELSRCPHLTVSACFS